MLIKTRFRCCEERRDEAIQYPAIRLAMAYGASAKGTSVPAFAVFEAGAGLLRRFAPRNDLAVA